MSVIKRSVIATFKRIIRTARVIAALAREAWRKPKRSGGEVVCG